jgi:N-formylmaleamate deformylase
MSREPSIQSRGRSGRFETDGLRLHYLEYGDAGPELVIVPGITSPAITWEFVAEDLAREHRVITLDVRGRGLSDRAGPGGYALESYAADVEALVGVVGLERPIVLGHSMGARIAAAFGALHPDAAGPLLVVDPPLSGPGREPYPFPLEPYVRSLHQAQAGATADDMRPFFPTWTDEQLGVRADWLGTCDETAVVETYENFHNEDFFDYWPRLRPPALFVYGLDSPVVPDEAVAEIAAANPAAQIEGVPAAGHMIPWDNLSGFLEVVRSFTRQ